MSPLKNWKTHIEKAGLLYDANLAFTSLCRPSSLVSASISVDCPVADFPVKAADALSS